MLLEKFEYTGEGNETLLLRKRKILLEKGQVVEARDEAEAEEISKHRGFKMLGEKKVKGGKR